MKKGSFSLIHPLSHTKDFMGQIWVLGFYWMECGELKLEVMRVMHTSYVNPDYKDWTYIPDTFWTWIENGSDRIGEIAYEHCKGLLPQPDITTDLQQEQHITDLKTQNELS